MQACPVRRDGPFWATQDEGAPGHCRRESDNEKSQHRAVQPKFREEAGSATVKPYLDSVLFGIEDVWLLGVCWPRCRAFLQLIAD